MQATQEVPRHGHDATEQDHAETQSNAAKDNQEYPEHPVAAMQDAFEESIREAAYAPEGNVPCADARDRRKKLLEAESYDASWAVRWQQLPDARCHPIVKLMAQIIFGLHLLHKQQAISESEVVKILQTHVDDIDKFLEKTTQDFDLAMADIEERMTCLKLPMQHSKVFDRMLDDRRFRRQLAEGNEKIEKIITRTAKEMNAVIRDIRKTINTVQQLAGYLDKVKDDWPRDASTASEVYLAMTGNETGWMNCLRELQNRGNQLDMALVRLGTLIGEMNKMIAGASRRARANIALPASTLKSANKTSRIPAEDKPLPQEPNVRDVALRAIIPPAAPTSPLDDSFMRTGKAPTPKVLADVPDSGLEYNFLRPASLLMQMNNGGGNLPLRSSTSPSQRSMNDRARRPSRSRSIKRNASIDATPRSGRSAAIPAASPGPKQVNAGDGLSQSLPSDTAFTLVPAPLQVAPKRDISRSRSTNRSIGAASGHTRQDSQSTTLTFATSRSSSHTRSHKSQPSQSSTNEAQFLLVGDQGEHMKTAITMHARNFSQPIKPAGLEEPGLTFQQLSASQQTMDQHKKSLSLPDSAYADIIIQPPSMLLPPIVPSEPLLSKQSMRQLRGPSPEADTGNKKSQKDTTDPDLYLMGNDAEMSPLQRNTSLTEPAYILESGGGPSRPATAPRPLTAMRSTTSLGVFPTSTQTQPSPADRKPSVSFQVDEPDRTAEPRSPPKQSRLTRLFRKKSTIHGPLPTKASA